MFAALKIPKAFLGYDENLGEKATLAAEDVRFARTIERIQKIVVSELTKIAIVHLYSQGYTDEDLVDFELNLTNPSTIYEQEKVELWSNKVSLADSLKDNKMLSEDWIYEKIFGLSKDEIIQEKSRIIEDLKQGFRKEQISMEGNDPQQSQEVRGTPHALAVLAQEDAEEDGDNTSFEEYGEMGGQEKGVPSYGSSQDSARGRDPLGKETRSIHREFFIKSLEKSAKPKASLLSENNILDDSAL